MQKDFEYNRKRAKEIMKILSKEIPDSRIALKFSNPLELLIATILSAQCTDVRVNEVTKNLFKKYRSAKDYGNANPAKLEEEIRPTGFFRNKAKSIQKCCQELVKRLGGEVPKTLEELVTLPGVGRKTANLVLTLGFGLPGICVDTHVHRISNRLGWVSTPTPDKTEQALRQALPRKHWIRINEILVRFGQAVCTPLSPRCSICVVRSRCPRVGVGRSR